MRRIAIGVTLCLATLSVARADDPPPAKKSDLESAVEQTNAFPAPGEIVVSGERGRVPLTFAHGRDVVDHETLAQYPQGAVSEALRQTPGVFVQSDAGNDLKMSIGIRGQQARVSSFTGILVDGVPVKQTLYGVVDLDVFPFTFERAGKIDVIRGGADLRYGPNAYGGVVNFVTEPIPLKPTVRVREAYGSDGEYSTLEEAGGTVGQFGVLVTGVKKGGDGWRVWDVITDEVSLVRGYKTQFNKIITEQSYDALIKKMKSKLKDGE